MVAALVVGMLSNQHAIWPHVPSSHRSQAASANDLRQLDRMKPQKQAETLLELAVGHSQGAVDQISSRVDRWNGKVEWNPQIASLTTAALNSNDMRVRESGVEVELAAYGLSKNSASLEYILNAVGSPDHSQKIWGLWALGLMANRGVETGRIIDVLMNHLKDNDVDSRRWAVEALALTGADEAIQPLLASMHDDPSPLVRERAACGLAESGMFTPEQRMTAVPQLLNYAEDAALDRQTRGWAFQALSDISHQRLPNDPAAWRKWYDSQR
jgi:HEAT repeat protein